ncbi:MAG: hypothetical protein AAF289_01325 [Cyanobacteria bacterium P01_A01_bin.135]
MTKYTGSHRDSLKYGVVASVVATGISLGTFVLGFTSNYSYNRISEKIVSIREDSDKGKLLADLALALMSGTSGVMVSASVVGIYHLMRHSILSEAKAISVRDREDIVREFGAQLQKLESALQKEKISPQAHGSVNNLIKEMTNIVYSLEVRKEAAKEIVSWLNEEDCKQSRNIQQIILKEALSGIDTFVTSEQSLCFSQDLKSCINWIRFTIQRRSHCRLDSTDRSQYLSAFDKNIYGGLSLYIESLESVKTHMMLSNNVGVNKLTKTRIISDTVDELISRLKRIAFSSKTYEVTASLSHLKKSA